ncbi:hypothetical protein BWD12_06685 [Leptospira santarosai serovar Bananal]|uniref:Uncharacterized protein n=1 Tax=Leptospira santarosai TaxID=28183 RepID=A0AB73MLG5_9LEPT|nr:Uncharacterized protein XB17_03627 [Leptospira santarosai]OLY64308.1 hypothetical protein BWD11_09570 [Leptospira santarosai serovar Grippotyphosa]ONF79915.1 hypothetical protein BWD12_06685 [Leptospira santarosai serovar Bananal]ONF91844.1 hypothetical protein BWD14_15120 [Leptospira santarosai]
MEKLSYDELRELQFLVWTEMASMRKFLASASGYFNLLDVTDSYASKLNQFALIDSKLDKLRAESLQND